MPLPTIAPEVDFGLFKENKPPVMKPPNIQLLENFCDDFALLDPQMMNNLKIRTPRSLLENENRNLFPIIHNLNNQYPYTGYENPEFPPISGSQVLEF